MSLLYRVSALKNGRLTLLRKLCVTIKNDENESS